MANYEEARIPVYINDEQAQSALKHLQTQTDLWRTKLNEALAAGDPKGVRKAEREMGRLRVQTARVKKEAWDVNKVLDNMSSASIGELYKAKRQLRTEMRGLKRDTEAYLGLKQKYELLNAEIRKGNSLTSKGASLFKRFLPIAGFTAGAAALRQIWNNAAETRKEFSRYEAVLKVATGSQRQANKELGMLQDFASKTPYQLSELTGAYVKLTNYGLKPTQEEMRQMGDLASSVGKGFDQLAEAQADAVTGEFERLKEFGIKARKEGDKITFTFKEQSTVVENNATAIKNYITGLGNMEGVAGSMAEISKTWGGAASNAGDATDKLYNAIGKRLEPSMVRLMGTYSRLASAVSDWIDGGQVGALQDEKNEVNRLVTQLQSANIEEETRKKLLEDLQELAPDLATAITDEKTGLNNLTTELEKYNSQMALKIVMKKQELAIEKQRGTAQTYQELAAEHEAKMIDAMNESLTWFEEKAPEYKKQVEGILFDDKLDVMQKAEKISKLSFEARKFGNLTLWNAIDDYKTFREAFADESNTLKRLTDDAQTYLENYKKIMGGNGPDPEKTDPDKPKDGDSKTIGRTVFKYQSGQWKIFEILKDVDGLNNETADKTLSAYQEQLNAILDGKPEESLPYQMVKLSPEEEEEIDADFEFMNKLFTSADENQRAIIEARHNFGIDSEEVYQAKLSELNRQGTDERMAKQKEQQQLTENIAMQMGELLGQTLADQEASFDEFGKSLVLMALRTLKTMIPIFAAKILGTELSQKGFPAGLITTGLATIALMTGVSAAEAAVKNSMKTSQRAKGKYDVVGEEDRKLYRNIPYVGSPQSGVYSNPTLISENGGEAVFTAEHTRRIMMFNPGLMEEAMAYRHRVPDSRKLTGGGAAQPTVVVNPEVKLAMFEDSSGNDFTSFDKYFKKYLETVYNTTND